MKEEDSPTEVGDPWSPLHPCKGRDLCIVILCC
jgi:hypothetical protein